ncbi:hypothetical protein D3C87_2080580 [compost metagenome]
MARSKSSVASFLRKIIMKRTASRPTSSMTSRSVTKSPERFDMRTCSPLRSRRTSWQSLTSSVPFSFVTAFTAACMRLT